MGARAADVLVEGGDVNERPSDLDLEHERLIACAGELLLAADAAGEPVAVRRAICSAVSALVRSRSPEQVARMERARGLHA